VKNSKIGHSIIMSQPGEGAPKENTVVTSLLGVKLSLPTGDVPVPLSLSYDGDDPYAVEIVIDIGLDGPFRWIFDREILAKGCDERSPGTEDGEIHVWPSEDDDSLLLLERKSPLGNATLELPRKGVEQVLAATQQIVAYGGEQDIVSEQFGAEIDGILG
jgi:hypothetical protein